MTSLTLYLLFITGTVPYNSGGFVFDEVVPE